MDRPKSSSGFRKPSNLDLARNVLEKLKCKFADSDSAMVGERRMVSLFLHRDSSGSLLVDIAHAIGQISLCLRKYTYDFADCDLYHIEVIQDAVGVIFILPGFVNRVTELMRIESSMFSDDSSDDSSEKLQSLARCMLFIKGLVKKIQSVQGDKTPALLISLLSYLNDLDKLRKSKSECVEVRKKCHNLVAGFLCNIAEIEKAHLNCLEIYYDPTQLSGILQSLSGRKGLSEYITGIFYEDLSWNLLPKSDGSYDQNQIDLYRLLRPHMGKNFFSIIQSLSEKIQSLNEKILAEGLYFNEVSWNAMIQSVIDCILFFSDMVNIFVLHCQEEKNNNDQCPSAIPRKQFIEINQLLEKLDELTSGNKKGVESFQEEVTAHLCVVGMRYASSPSPSPGVLSDASTPPPPKRWC